jgi:multidrug efflux pump subunit AcrA (membrane-fusion protein)
MNRLAGITVALVPFGLGCALLFAGCSRPAPTSEEEVPVAPVRAETAKEAVFGEWTELVGATQPLPDRVARVTAPVEGHVVSVLTGDDGKPVAEGQPVAKGQLIVRLDDRVARAQRDKILAMLDELGETRRQADLAYQIASLEVDRLVKLNPPGTSAGTLPLVSKIEIERAKLTQQDAESKQRGVAAKEKTLRADLNVLELQLDYHLLRAPITGTLGPILVAPGQTLAIGTTVADVTDLAELDVVAYAPPAVAQKLRLGQLAWYPGKAAGEVNRSGPQGKVVFIAAQAQPDTGNFLVKVRFPNEALLLRANQVTRARVLTQGEEARVTIPEAALLEDQDPPGVVVAEDVQVKKDHDGKDQHIGKARVLRAHLGIRDRARHVVEVLRLEDPETKEAFPVVGTQYIVEGGHGLHNGDLVKLEQPHEK